MVADLAGKPWIRLKYDNESLPELATMSRWQARSHLEQNFLQPWHRFAPRSNLYKGLESSEFGCKNHFCSFKLKSYKYFYIIILDGAKLDSDDGEAVAVSAHGCLYLLIHCTVGAPRASVEYFGTVSRPNTPIGRIAWFRPSCFEGLGRSRLQS